MAVENITLNLIPTGDKPSIHVAQFDVDRPFNVTLKEGTDDFTPTGYTIELQVRKVDNNIVTTVPEQTSGNVVTFNTTEQMTACSGTNLAELQLTKDSQTFATLHFYLVVQRGVLAGGVTSESDIYNLTEQIAAIVPEVIGDDYYNKEEVDDKIADIPTFDPTNYYDKSDVDTLLNDKADVSDLPDMTNYYDKSETDALLDDKADVSDLPDMSNYYNKTEVDNKITDLYQIKTVSGSIAHITDGGDNIPVKSLVSQIVAVQSGSGTPSPSNPRAISGFDSGVITVTDNDQITNTYTFTFGQTVYGGYFDNKGDLVVTHVIAILDGTENTWSQSTSYDFRVTLANMKSGNYLSGIAEWLKTATDTSEPLSIRFGANNNIVYFYGIINNISGVVDLASWKTYLSNNPLKLVYELDNPIVLPITSQNIPTLLGENNIFSNTGDVEVEYFTEKSDGIAELIKAFI
jgi:hypothetical protein